MNTAFDRNKFGETLIGRFSSKYFTTNTFPFSNLSPQKKELILSQVKLTDDESPLIACLVSDRAWLLITTERIFWTNEHDKQPCHLSWEELENVAPSGSGSYGRVIDPYIVISDKAGNCYAVEVFPGGDKLAIEYLLAFIISKLEP